MVSAIGVQALVDVMTMVLDGLFGNHQPAGDFSIRQPAGDKLHDLVLAAREPGRSLRDVGFWLVTAVDQCGRGQRREVRQAVGDTADYVGQLPLVKLPVYQVTAGARRDGLDSRCQHHDPRRLADLRGSLDPARSG
jgi:hypothetical protein